MIQYPYQYVLDVLVWCSEDDKISLILEICSITEEDDEVEQANAVEIFDSNIRFRDEFTEISIEIYNLVYVIIVDGRTEYHLKNH